MKNLFLTVAMAAIAFTANANDEEAKTISIGDQVELSENSVEINQDATTPSDAVFTTYRGRCLDGTTFTFSADSQREAQAFVNGFCAGRRTTVTIEDEVQP